MIVAYYSLILTIVGTLLNLLTFFILCRFLFRNIKAKPTLHYMRAIAIFDILMLYGWNLEHYTRPVHGFSLQRYSIFACKLLSFINYYAAQTSAWLRVFVSLDQYLLISRLHKTWFNNSKHILIIIASIMTVLLLLNLHFFIFVCYHDKDGKIISDSALYSIFPLWEYIHLAVYNSIPFILMVVFNSGSIYHLLHIRRTTTIQNSRIHHRSISITLIITTFLFLIMTVPATIAFAFFPDTDRKILHLLDCILYSYHITSFPLYMITFKEFRQEFITIIKCKMIHRRVGSLSTTIAQSSS